MEVRESVPDNCTCASANIVFELSDSHEKFEFLLTKSKSRHVSCCFRQTNKAHLWLVPALDTDSYIFTAYNLDALDTGSNKSAIVACNKLLKKHPKNILLKVLNPIPLCSRYSPIYLVIESTCPHSFPESRRVTRTLQRSSGIKANRGWHIDGDDACSPWSGKTCVHCRNSNHVILTFAV